VNWIGPEGLAVDWQNDRSLGMYIKGKDKLLLLFNNEAVDLSFELPEGDWELSLATDPAATSPAHGDSTVLVPAHSVCILTA
jgi:pullulanase/glycogen debranching enzyme